MSSMNISFIELIHLNDLNDDVALIQELILSDKFNKLYVCIGLGTEEDFKNKNEPKQKEFRFLGSQGLQKVSTLQAKCDRVVIF